MIDRARDISWPDAEHDLRALGYYLSPPLLTPEECRATAALFDDDQAFRKRINMARHRFGSGEYKYFGRPLPAIVQQCRTSLYAGLAPIANAWMEALGDATRYPAVHREAVAGRRFARRHRTRYDGGVMDRDDRPASSIHEASARLRSALAAFAVGLRQVWQGYWQSPPGA
jgi:hypothetical protein